jgi:hypothetical protein
VNVFSGSVNLNILKSSGYDETSKKLFLSTHFIVQDPAVLRFLTKNPENLFKMGLIVWDKYIA